jgi:uncharacterized membrane protein YqjE
VYRRQDAHATVSDGDSQTFTRLLNRLVGDVLRLLDQKVALLKLELKEDLAALARRSAVMAAGAALALVGSVLLLLALAIWLGELVGSMPGGFAILGGALVLVGAILVVTMRKRLTEGSALVPEQTVQELRRDAQWIKHEL